MTISRARITLVLLGALAATSRADAEFVGFTSPTSFSVCETATDGTGRPRPECQGGDVRYQLTGASTSTSEFGFAVAAGHLDGDNLVDLVVGDPKRNRVYIFFGRLNVGGTYDLDPNSLADRLVSAETQADVILTREPPFPGQVGSFGFSVAVSSERVAAAGCGPTDKTSALLIGAPGKPGTTGNAPGTAFHIAAGRLCAARSDPPVPLVRDPLDLGGQSLQSPSAASDDEFGYSVAFGRLLTNTGTDPDVIVGSRGARAGAGAVTMFRVSGGTVATLPSGLVRVEGEPGDGLGESLAVGDLDQDFDMMMVPRGHLDDLAIGAVGHPMGKAVLLQGPAAPTDGRDGDGILREGIDSQIRSIAGEVSGDFFGLSLAISAQGSLAVGAVFADNVPPNSQQPGGGNPLTNVSSGSRFNAGKVYVWEEPVVDVVGVDSPAASADTVLVARRSGDQLGFGVAYGDFDGSGRDDLAITARREDGTGLKVDEIDHGAVYVVYDNTALRSPVDLNVCAVSSDCTGVSGVDVLVFGGNRANNLGDEIGFAIATGNLNGDTSVDLFVSSITHQRVYAVTLEDTDADRLNRGRNIRDGDDDNDAVPDSGDCAPLSATVKPGATEILCNGIDENCNGITDDAPDADGDTFDACNANAPGDRDDKPADCADTDAASRPGAAEVCDGNDNDCSGTVPSAEQDPDNDRYVGCSGWNDTQGDNAMVLGGDDCDRVESSTFPGAAPKEATPSACMRDRDGDDFGDLFPPVGVTAGTDCDDGTATAAMTFPGAAEAEAAPGACRRDADGDGFGDVSVPTTITAGTDCNDRDMGSRPGATEVCDGNDNDCSGSPLPQETDPDGDGWVACSPWDDPQMDNPAIDGGGDCAPSEGTAFPGSASSEAFASACMKDSDGDNYGDVAPPAGITPGTDCNDAPGIGAVTFPGAAEIEAPLNCMKDGDADGWGDSSASLPVVRGTDCNDALASAFPGGTEVVDDSIDQDCSGSDSVTCFTDVDRDGFGIPTLIVAHDGSCSDPGEAPKASIDCNDAVHTIFPGAPETPEDGIDQDCNDADTIRCVLDEDKDGFGTALGTMVLAGDGQCDPPQQEATMAGDCSDSDANTHPGATERCDGNANTCSGPVPVVETDPDGDHFASCAGWSDTQEDNPGITGGGDCAAGDADTFPGAASGEVFATGCMRDKDGDNFGDLAPPAGVTPGTDCDDSSPSAAVTFPGAAQVEAPLNCMRDMDDDGYGDAAALLPIVAGGDCDDSVAATRPGVAESCDGNDNDCSGAAAADELDPDGDGWVACVGWADTQGDNPGIAGGGDCAPDDPTTSPGAAPFEPFSAACMQDKDGDNFGDLTPPAGITAGTDCDDDSPAAATTFPGAAEVEAPLNCMKDTDNDGWGDGAASLPVVAGDDCNDAVASIHPGAAEVCGDMVDSDCNGDDPPCPVTMPLDLEISGAAQLSWQLPPGYTLSRVYRGDLGTLRSTGLYTQEPGSAPGASRFCNISASELEDTYWPEPGRAVFYLFTVVTPLGESSLGLDSAGFERPNANPCPAGRIHTPEEP